MEKLDFATLYGYFLLAQEGLTVFNPQYVQRYGEFMRCILRLKSKNKPNEAYLLESYTESANSAKFFATYPKNLRGMSAKALRELHKKALENKSDTSF